MLFSILSAVLAIFIAYSIRWRLKLLKLFRENNIPGPPPRFLWGSILDIYRHGQLTMFEKWHKQYGPVFGYFHGVWPVVVVADADLMKQVMFRNFHKFADRCEFVNAALVGGFEGSLIGLSGQRWKEVRGMLTPSFTSKKLKEITPTMCACVDGFMENVDNDFKKSATCDLYEFYQALTLDTICKSAMGVDYRVQKDFRNSKALRRVRTMLSIQLDFAYVLFASFPILITLLARGSAKLYFYLVNNFEDPIKAFKKETEEVVKLRKSNPEEYRRSDLLQLMMDAQNRKVSATNSTSLTAEDTPEGSGAEKKPESAVTETTNSGGNMPSANKPKELTDGELIDNALIVLVAGYETTSTSLAFLTKMLVRFPEVQERVRAELVDATKGGKVYDFDRLQNCQYTEAVIQETLRMYPPVFFLQGRIAAEDMRFGKMTIPKGSNVFASVREIQYKDDVFPEPHKFRPERFLPENKTPAMVASFLPFGSGPRYCIGMRFAQMEIKVTLAKLLTKYRISAELEPKYDPLIPTVLLPIVQQISEPIRYHLEQL